MPGAGGFCEPAPLSVQWQACSWDWLARSAQWPVQAGSWAEFSSQLPFRSSGKVKLWASSQRPGCFSPDKQQDSHTKPSFPSIITQNTRTEVNFFYSTKAMYPDQLNNLALQELQRSWFALKMHVPGLPSFTSWDIYICNIKVKLN